MGNIEGDEVVIAGLADWEIYDQQQWASFILDVAETREFLEEYAEQVRNGELTDQEALDEFLSEASGLGGADATLAISLSETREGPPPNI